MDFEMLHYPSSSNSDISEDEFYHVKQGEYTRFDSFDDDIEIIKSNASLNKSVDSGQYFQYDTIDDIVIVNPKLRINKLANSKGDGTDVNQNISSELASKYDEVIQEIQILNTTRTEKIMTNNSVNSKTYEPGVSQNISFEFNSINDETVKEIKEVQILNVTATEKIMTNNLVNFKTDEPDVSRNISFEFASKYDQIVKEFQILNITETEKVMTNNLANTKTDEPDCSQNNAPGLVSKYDEAVQDINELQVTNTTKTEKLSPLEGFRKRLQRRISDDFSKYVKRPNFLNKLKHEKYSGIFRSKSKSLCRTYSVPKIFIFSPNGTGHDTTDSGNDSDSSDDVNIFKKQLDRLERWSSNQKLHVSTKKKAMRKSI